MKVVVVIELELYRTICTPPYLMKLLIYLTLIACKEVAQWWQLLAGLLNNEKSLFLDSGSSSVQWTLWSNFYMISSPTFSYKYRAHQYTGLFSTLSGPMLGTSYLGSI